LDSGSLDKLCVKCSHTSCCNNFVTPFVTSSEKEKISQIGHNNFSDDFSTHGMNVHALKKKPGTDECVFWDKNNGCGIYESRPFDCMLFPFDIYKINGEYTWVVYSCNPESDWTWSEKILETLEEEIISEDVIKHIDAYSDVSRLDVSDKSFDLVELRKVNLKIFKQKEPQVINERRRSSTREIK
jgi:Fe-S-cluster containining protein